MTETLGVDSTLGHHLVQLLVDHGVRASQGGGLVRVGADESRWVRLTAMRDDSSSSAVRLHIDAGGPGGVVLTDSLNGLGADAGVALTDALKHFCLGDFHVLLAGLWGILEEDQVDHFTVSTENGPWDLYFGAWVSRMSDLQNPLPAPEAAFLKAVVEACPTFLIERKARAGRMFVAVLNGELTYEALLDMEPSDDLDRVLRAVPLAPPASGYASQRLFFLALPRDGEPAHSRVGRCTPLGAPAGVEASRANLRLWMALAACALLIGAAYALMR